jgi:hypothetical protein
MGSIVVITIAIGALTRSTIPVTLGLISTAFLFMYNNSKNSILQITDNLHHSVNYIVLMFGVAFLIIILITIMDYASGQSTTGVKH